MFVKVGRGEANGKMIGTGPKVAFDSKTSVANCNGARPVVLLFRLGNYSKPFRAFIDHHDPDMPSPLPFWEKSRKIAVHIFERDKQPSRSITVDNRASDWASILRTVEAADPWSTDAFELALQSLLGTPTQAMWRQLQSEGFLARREQSRPAEVDIVNLAGGADRAETAAERLVVERTASIEEAYTKGRAAGFESPIVMALDTSDPRGRALAMWLHRPGDGGVEVVAINRKAVMPNMGQAYPDLAEEAPSGFFHVLAMAGGSMSVALMTAP